MKKPCGGYLFILVVVFLLGTVSGFVLSRLSPSEPASKPASPGGSENPGAGVGAAGSPLANPGGGGTPVIVNVAVKKTAREPLTEYLLLPAVAEAWQDVALASELAGKLAWIGAKEGDRVTAGQEIARIDTDDLEVAVRQAEAELEFAQADLKRIEELRAQDVSSADELDRASTTFKAVQARRDAAVVTLRKAVIRSPIDGIVDDLPVEVGEYVSAGEMIAQVVRKDRLKIVARLPEKDARYVEPGMEVQVFPDLSSDPVYSGEVYYLSQTASPDTRTYRLEVALDNASDLLRVGMIVKIRLLRRQIDDAIVIPLFAIIPGKEGRFVFVEENGVAHERRVELGVFDGVRAQVLSGLAEGENLIVSGHRMLTDGDRVRPVETLP